MPWHAVPMQLSALDHGAMLTCINPKALLLPGPGRVDGVAMRRALAAALATYPILAGRCVGTLS